MSKFLPMYRYQKTVGALKISQIIPQRDENVRPVKPDILEIHFSDPGYPPIQVMHDTTIKKFGFIVHEPSYVVLIGSKVSFVREWQFKRDFTPTKPSLLDRLRRAWMVLSDRADAVDDSFVVDAEGGDDAGHHNPPAISNPRKLPKAIVSSHARSLILDDCAYLMGRGLEAEAVKRYITWFGGSEDHAKAACAKLVRGDECSR